MFDEPDTRRGTLITGEQLLQGFRYLDAYVAGTKTFPALDAAIANARARRPRDQPWEGLPHIARAVHNAHARTLLEDSSSTLRAEMNFNIPAVVQSIVLDANPPELGKRSLDADGKNVLHYVIETFLVDVAAGRIPVDA